MITTVVTKKGFTLIELLVVISIISLLSSALFASLNTSRAKARDAVRKTEMKALQTALAAYYSDYGAYPSTGGAWYGISASGGSRSTSGASGYIPNLAPTYIPVLPVDPLRDTSGYSGYLYNSDGTNYILLDHVNGPESYPSSSSVFYDPVRPTHAWKLCSAEPACSSW